MFEYYLWTVILIAFALFACGLVAEQRKNGCPEAFGFMFVAAIVGDIGWISWAIGYAKEGSLALAVMMCG
jgi:hypothetical protein